MSKFKVKHNWVPSYYISDGNKNYMHRDGEIVLDACEYWPTEEKAQAVLDKFQSSLLSRVWVHGDVFQNCVGTWIYLIWNDEPHVLDLNRSQTGGTPEIQLEGDDVEFLFNVNDIVKDALSDRGLA